MNEKQQKKSNLIIASSPHLRSEDSTQRIMGKVLIALLPIIAATTFIYGERVLVSLLIASATAVLAEYLIQKAMKRPQTIQDLSALVTAVILVLNLPLNFPFWQLILGTIFAIIVVKAAFGGLGQNFANPAMTARIVLVSAFGGSFRASQPLARALRLSNSSIDALSGPTVLSSLSGGTELNSLPGFRDLFFGIKGSAAIGEACILAILLGGIYLLASKVIKWHIPLTYIGTVAVFSLLYSGFDARFMLCQLLSGGLMFGAFFMATDYSTSPITDKGKIVFGIGLGLLTSIIRFYGNLPEGTSYAILFMNILTPHIDRFTKVRSFGSE